MAKKKLEVVPSFDSDGAAKDVADTYGIELPTLEEAKQMFKERKDLAAVLTQHGLVQREDFND